MPAPLRVAGPAGGPASAGLELLSGWGRSPAVLAEVAAPRTEPDVDALFERAPARGLIARGAGHSLGDAAQRAGGLVVRATGLERILAFDPERGVATVEAGISLGELLRAVVPHGWFPAVLPATRFVTVGGAIAADVHGRNQEHDGNFANHVTAIRLRTPRETLTVGPHAMPDLFWATAGGMGLTGVILDATLQLVPIETARMRVRTERATDLDDAMARMTAGAQRERYSAAWIDPLARGGSLGRGLVKQGDHAVAGEVDGRDGMAFAPAHQVRLPVSYAARLARGSVRVTNELVYRRAPTVPREDLQSVQAFFHTHDRLDIFQMYAPRGAVEYQFVVPFSAADVVRAVIERIAAARIEPFFAVLKRFGRRNPGQLSFPAPGWMAAFDFAVGPGLADVLDDLDALVAAAGGRIYLAKDARLRPGLLPAMYEDLSGWREIRARHDPDGVMRSDLAERLDLP